MAANPWGLDEAKYFVSVGGLQGVLDIAGGPPLKNKREAFTEDLQRVMDLQARHHKESLEYDRVLSLLRFSDLLLSHSCCKAYLLHPCLETSAAQYKRMTEFLQLILANQGTIASALSASKQTEDSSLLLERRHHSSLLSLLGDLAQDLTAGSNLDTLSRCRLSIPRGSTDSAVDQECTLCQRYLEQAT